MHKTVTYSTVHLPYGIESDFTSLLLVSIGSNGIGKV